METSNNFDQEHILTDIEPSLEPASVGKRFANYIIDAVAYYAIIFVLGIILALTLRDDYIEFIGNAGQGGLFVYCILIYFLYLSLLEGFCNGRTLGKLCTGSRVVREDGSRIGFGTAVLRTLIRFIPFEAFSIFFGSRPWHDAWTNTYVIDIRKSTFPDPQAA